MNHIISNHTQEAGLNKEQTISESPGGKDTSSLTSEDGQAVTEPANSADGSQRSPAGMCEDVTKSHLLKPLLHLRSLPSCRLWRDGSHRSQELLSPASLMPPVWPQFGKRQPCWVKAMLLWLCISSWEALCAAVVEVNLFILSDFIVPQRWAQAINFEIGTGKKASVARCVSSPHVCSSFHWHATCEGAREMVRDKPY